MADRVDVAIVGASLAGCATAVQLGRAGLRVALVDKHAGPDAFKRLCGHFIQASATSSIERLGLAEPIEAAGGVRNGLEFWTKWGMIEAPPGRPYGYNIRRSKLDPMIRGLALDTPGVEYMPGQRLVGLDDSGPSAELELTDRAGARHSLSARLVVGADGRNSTVAALAGARERRFANHRFCFGSYYSGIDLPPGSGGRAWLLGYDIALAAPNDDGITVLAVFLDKRGLAPFREDRARALLDYFKGLPDPLELGAAERVDKVVGTVDYDLISRDPTPSARVALVGDAAATSDPATGVGCGWAFQGAEWLANSVAPALAGEEPLAAGLRRYRRVRRRQLGGHQRVIAFDARRRRMNAGQRLLISAGTVDAQLAGTVISFSERLAPPQRLITPAAIARATRIRAGQRLTRS